MDTVKKIMIADDDPAILEMMSTMLEFEGYAVSATLDGTSLLELSDKNLPDLLLLDIWMSGSDGREICRLLKEKPVTHAVPIVLFSASKDIAASAMAAGADDFLAKPFEMDDLIRKIEQLIGN